MFWSNLAKFEAIIEAGPVKFAKKCDNNKKKSCFQLYRGLSAMGSAVETEIHAWATGHGWAQIFCYKNQGIHWYHCNPKYIFMKNQLHVGTKVFLAYEIVQTAEIIEKNVLPFQDFWRRTKNCLFLKVHLRPIIPLTNRHTIEKNKDFVSPRFRRRYLSNSQKNLQIPCTSLLKMLCYTYFMEKIEL